MCNCDFKGKWSLSVLCGIAGAVGALFAKMGFQPGNWLYTILDYIPYGQWIGWVLRAIFILLCIFANLKMVEYKIRSFAAIGSSLTVIISF